MPPTATRIFEQRAIIHVDMDAFYASIEQHDNPRYRNRPVIVGGTGRRGVVAAASYEVRKFGVHSAMPMSRARRLCSTAVILPVRMSRYREISSQVFSIFHKYTPQVEGLSLDEAFLDVTGSLELFGSIEKMGAMVRTDILVRSGLHASVGMAHNKFLAKLASDIGKPRGFVHVDAAGVEQLLDPMPVGRIWGIGKQTLPKLHKLGILTIGQLRKADPVFLRQALGRQVSHFQALARGEDERVVVASRPDKSISREVTFAQDISNRKELLSALQRQAESVCGRLRRRQLAARTIQVKIRDNNFHTVTRSHSLKAFTASTDNVYQRARHLLLTWLQQNDNTPVRLLGISLSGLAQSDSQDEQLDSSRQMALDATMDAIKDRFGDEKAIRALAMQKKTS